MLSDAARALWAKSNRGKKDVDAWHPVIGHLLDVAACAWEIFEREPLSTLELFASDLQLDVPAARAWVCALAGLHDLGKASPAFQQKWSAGCERVKSHLPWADNQTPPPLDTPHSAISQVELCKLLPSKGWSLRAAQLAADAVGAHHGWRVEHELLGRADTRAENGGAKWSAVREELFQTVLEVLNVRTVPQVDTLSAAAFQRLAGLTSFADWIGSSFSFTVFGDPTTYFQQARALARAALDSVGWTTRAPLQDVPASLPETFSYLVETGAVFQPRALQTAIATLLNDVDAPALFVVEAPMGEGKTEAALYAHLELQRRNGHRGLYVALPTQATGNAMFERTKDFLTHFSKERQENLAARLDLQLLHGATLLKEEYQSIVIRGVDEKEDEAVVARSYFSHRKRALLSEYGVGTVDQALLSVLNIKHQFVRLWGLGNRVVVLDEVHAYDTYSGSLIESLVQWLHALGSSVIVMSATLPAKKRANVLEAFGAADAETKQYPRITRVVNGETTCVHVPATATKSVRLEPLAQDDIQVANKLVALTEHRGCAVFIANTVDRAQRLYQLLKDRTDGVDVMLFHARFPVQDRQRRELECLRSFSKDGSKPNPNRPLRSILIATQVVEQSLDLDFDVMVSDLAPVDLLLQRAGRLHRHVVNAAARGEHIDPVLYVAGLTPPDTRPDLETNHWHRVYDPYILLRTWRVLVERQNLEFPKDINDLVQIVYGDAPLGDLDDGLKQELEAKREKLERDEGRDVLDAARAVIGDPRDASWEDPTRGFRSHLEDEPTANTKRVGTRKGEESVTVVPVFKVGNTYSLKERDAKPVSFAAKLSVEDAKAIYGHSVRLSRPAVVYGINAHVKQYFDSPPWQETPLLQGVMPLVLEAGWARFGGTVVRLENELGVVYSK
jgi:CRISPR-associated endonuclease/helicase Cas3